MCVDADPEESRCIVGILMMKAKRSSMKVFSALYMKVFHGICAVDLSL